jgi:polysaccharide export outer membrane protein
MNFMTFVIKKLFYIGMAAALSAGIAGSVLAQGAVAKPAATPAPIDPQDMRFKERYRFGFQDTIEVEVFKHPEYSIKVEVGQDGTIRLPRIDKPIMAVCKTERELAEDIKLSYAKYLREPFVSVRAAEQKSQSFAVIGNVEKPGAFFLSRRIKLLELLSFAGGPNRYAGSKVLVARTGSYSVCQTDVPDVKALIDTGNPDVTLLSFDMNDVIRGKESIWMQPGDIVSVPEADQVYVVGNVNKPTTVSLKKEVTLSQAIAAAEGLKPATKKDKVRILRKKPDSVEREVIYCDMGKIEKAEAPDPILQADDIVAVQEDGVKAITNGVIKALVSGAASLPYYLRF